MPPLVNKCCICVPLRFGSMVIGWMSLIITVALLGHYIRMLYNIEEERFLEIEMKNEAQQHERKHFDNLFHLLIILSVMQVMSSVFILLGVYQRVCGYLYTAAICLALLALVQFVEACIRSTLIKFYPEEILLQSLALVAWVYCAAVLWSYGEQLEKTDSSIAYISY